MVAVMEFDKEKQRILLSIDEREATDRLNFFGGIPIEGLPLLRERVAGYLAVSDTVEQQRTGRSSEDLFAHRRRRNILEQMQQQLPAIQQAVWGELFEEPPDSLYLLD
jgi:hypothetical protein